MTKLTFYNGLREIGGTFVEVETDKAKCMFDFGFAVADRLDSKVNMRKKAGGADYVALGMLTPADGIYDENTAGRLNVAPYGKTSKECFFIISHMHIDHMGGLGLLHPDIPVYMSTDSLRLYRRLEKNNDLQAGGAHPNCIGIDYGKSFTVGDITVEVLPIDHDVIGASGFLITTEDGSICYTGDYRFHGFHPEVTKDFADKVKGADVMITEGVTISFDDVDMISLEEPEDQGRTEESLLEEMISLSKEKEGLLVINPYNRNVERLHRLIASLASAGRTLVFDEVAADYTKEFFPDDDICIYRETIKSTESELTTRGFRLIGQDEILANPSKYVLQLDYADFYELLDLKEVISLYIHMDGSPLGDYDPSYAKMKSMLEAMNITYEYHGTGGHAKPYYLRYMADTIEPKTLIPLHSYRPYQFVSKKAGRIVLPKYGETVYL